MSTLNDVLKGIRETILLNERMVRVETFLEFLRPALQRRLPKND